MMTVRAYELAKDAPEKFKGAELCRLMKLVLQARKQMSHADYQRLYDPKPGDESEES